jgi:signal transduction histidine kinase
VHDTVKAVAQKKGFFKKLGSLFSNKDNTQYKYVSSDSSHQSTEDSTKNEMNEVLNNLSGEIQKFYQGSLDKELSIRRKLNEKEKALAETNLSIIDDINIALENVLQKEELDERIRNNTALANAINARDSIKNISSVSFAIILIIVIILIFNIAQTMRYERDILTSKERAEKLAVTKTRYLNNMSHEIRTPLTSIIGFTEQVIKMEYDEDKKKYLEAIRTSSDHLLSTVNDILDFSKLEAGKLDLQKRHFNLCKTIEEVAYAFSITAEKKGIHLHLNMLVDNDLMVVGDDFR